MTVSPEAQVDQPRNWFNKPVEDVVAEFATNTDSGLSAAEAGSRLASHGPNVIAAEPSPSVWAVALVQLKDSMNLMLIAVTGVSMLIQEWSTAMIVAFLVVLNVVMGTQQEMKARASVDALAEDDHPAGEGRARRHPDAGQRHRPGPRGHRDPGVRGHRARRRATGPLGHPGDPGGRADRGERPDQQGPLDHRPRRGGARRSHEHGVPEHVGHPGHRGDGGHRDRYGHPDGADRDHAVGGGPEQVAVAERVGLADEGPRARSRGSRWRSSSGWVCTVARTSTRCCCWGWRWRSRRSRPVCPRSSRRCWHTGPRSWQRPRRS